MDKLTDFLRQQISIGDVLIYPVRRGSSLHMRRLTVTRICLESGAVTGLNTEGRTVTISKPERSILVTKLLGGENANLRV